MSLTGGINTPSFGQDDHTPLWKYVTKCDKVGQRGGHYSFKCNYCQKVYKGSYSRVKAHLLKIYGHGIRGCNKVTFQHLLEMQKVVEEAELRVKNTLPKRDPLPTSTQPSASSAASMGIGGIESFRHEAFDPRKRKATGNSALEKAFKLGDRDHLHSEIARMFYSAGLPFQLARNPYYVSSYSYAANNSITGYLPPRYDMLRTTLLQKEKENIKRLLEPIKSTWRDKGISIVCEGWTDAQRRPLINFMAVTENGPMFLKVVNCQGEYKDKYFIANMIKKTIEEVGHQNVVQVITDNAPVCKAAGYHVEAHYPHIFWTPCVMHTLNLVLKNICAAKNTDANEVIFDECSWITIIVGDIMVIKNFIMNNSMRLVIFNELVNLKMLAVADTRFASVIVMLKRFKLIKRGLQSMVISDNWYSYREDDEEKAGFVKEKVLDDLWWDKIDYIISFTRPIYDMLRIANTDKSCLHLIYDMWNSMIEKVKTVIYRHEGKQETENSTFYLSVHNILENCWNKSITHLHCLAHSLNLRYYSSVWLNEAPNRIAPHKDNGISNSRKKCFNRYFPNNEERRTINVEYAKFSMASDEFSDNDSIEDREVMEPIQWWVVHGASAPMLQTLAFKLLKQPCSSSCCERNWSTYSFIHSMQRNKITPRRVEDLVFVHANLRLLSRRNPQYMQGESKMWDVGGDAFDSFEDTGVLEIANLSLDEPDLEAMIFTDDGDDDPIEVGSN